MRPRAALALALVVALGPGLGGCLGGGADPGASLVPYPRVGDVAVYEVAGGYVDLARWENGFAFPAARVRFTLLAGGDVIDGARAVHPTFKLTTEIAQASAFVKHSEKWVSPRHGTLVQTLYPLSQDQSIVAFDERGYPWLWGASALVGEDLAIGRVAFGIPDNLGRGASMPFAWVVRGEEDGLTRLDLEGEGASATLWLGDESPWPARASVALTDALAPHVRVQDGEVRMEARLVSLERGGESVEPRDRGASFADDLSVERVPWDGEKPPDGDISVISYPLADAVAESKLLDKPLRDWLAGADAPILYRATFQETAGPVQGSTSALWLLQWVDRSDAYYEVQISKTFAPPAGLPQGLPATLPGLPKVESSGPAQAPADANHGWFDPGALPEKLVPLSEGIRVVRETFGAGVVQIFLRSFADPPGYSYFLDGGMEEGGVGRYTVVYNPSTGFIEQATGPVTPRLAG